MVVQMMMNPQGAQNGGRPTEPGGPPAKGNQLGTASATGELPPQATGGPVPGDSVIEQAGALGTAAPGMDGSIGGGYQ
jgi:hypothetical protein